MENDVECVSVQFFGTRTLHEHVKFLLFCTSTALHFGGKYFKIYIYLNIFVTNYSVGFGYYCSSVACQIVLWVGYRVQSESK